MAQVSYTRGVRLVLKLGDGASPEVFTALCSINAQRGLTFNAQTNDEVIPDCADPDAIAWVAREKQSLSVEFTGAGMSHKNDVAKLWAWFESELPKNCQIILDDDTAANDITFEGAFHLSSFELNGERGNKVQFSMTCASDGEVNATFGANVQ